MIDHINLRVSDFAKMVEFYRQALAPIGYSVLMEFPNATGLGKDNMPDLWISANDQPVNPTHLAFGGDRSAVDAFHPAALAAGASDNGPPGVRADYHPHYYAAYVIDPEGNNIEVVCHVAPGAPKPKKSAAPAAKKSAAKARKPAPKKKPAAKAKAKAKAKPAKKRR